MWNADPWTDNLDDGLNTGILYIKEYENSALQGPKTRGPAIYELTKITYNPVAVGT